MSILFSDNFQRADNPTSMGNGWIASPSGAVFGIQNNGPVLKANGAFASSALQSLASNCTVSITRPAGRWIVDGNVDLQIRATDAKNLLLIYCVDRNDDGHQEFEIDKIVNGVSTSFVSPAIPALLDPQFSKLSVQAAGNILTFFANDVQVYQVDLSTTNLNPILTGSGVGFHLNTVNFLNAISLFQVTNLPMNGVLLDEIGNWLTTQGVVGGSTGWTLYKSFVPPDPDQVIVVSEIPGEMTDVIRDPTIGENPFDTVGFQIRGRSSVNGYAALRAQMQLIFEALHQTEPPKQAGVENYVFVYAKSPGPLPMGKDSSNRDELSWNFRAMRQR